VFDIESTKKENPYMINVLRNRETMKEANEARDYLINYYTPKNKHPKNDDGYSSSRNSNSKHSK
jgi:hypothetical protein